MNPPNRVWSLTLIAMLAFAGNSLLCRQALRHTAIDAASFTVVRLVSGALALALIVALRQRAAAGSGNWLSALALFAYAAAFSFSYVSLPAAAGALLLFGAVQATMIGYGLCSGERMAARQLAGLAIAAAGLLVLLLPGLSAPPLIGSAWMVAAGVAWGVYSLRARGAGDPTRVTAGNFWRAAVIAAILALPLLPSTSIDAAGLAWAVASGALTSGVGYAVWYAALRGLPATSAATVQLSVPVLAAIGAVLWLDEALTLRLALSAVAVLGGIWLVIGGRSQPR